MQRIRHGWAVMAMAVALAGCAPDPESGGYAEAPSGLEGLFEVSNHEAQLGCKGEPTPVAELPMEEALPTTPLFVLVYEPGDFGGTQIVALACAEDETCDVDHVFRKFYDLDGQWKYAVTNGRVNDEGSCDVSTFVDTLETDNGGDDVVMELRVTAGSVELPDGDADCTGPVRATEPDDLPCTRVERIVGTRIKE